MIPILERIKQQRVYMDGGMGTLLLEEGYADTEPELVNIEDPDEITKIHREYLDAGCTVITTNTFGVNCLKYDNYGELIRAAFACAHRALRGFPDRYIAFDIGPTGRMLNPLGDMQFEDAVEVFARSVRAAAGCGADCILIETMGDSYETKAAVLAAKENSSLPVFVTNVYDGSGKLLTGADPKAMTAMLEGLGCDALGMNCSLGPDRMLPLVPVFAEYSSVPVIVSPNAGMPRVDHGKTVYDISPDEFAGYMREIALAGATVLGGCCGTTPEYMRRVIRATKDLPYKVPEAKNHTLASSYTHAVEAGTGPLLIGERINPTGRPKMKEALRSRSYNYILKEGISESEAGVPVLDVNVGLADIDEREAMTETVKRLQSVSDCVLQIDTSDPAVLESALRVYNGKAIVNSVNGTSESLNCVLPLVKKYGGVLIVLTIGEDGIPKTPEERVDVAEHVALAARDYGISKKDLIVDPLAMTISSDPEGAQVTLETLRVLKERGFLTSLGISNISFGLPEREMINAAFFTMALEEGLDCAIINPFSAPVMDAYYSFRALKGLDANCEDYIAYAGAVPHEVKDTGKVKPAAPPVSAAGPVSDNELFHAVYRGLKENAQAAAAKLLGNTEPPAVIDNYIIPALNAVGKDYEEKRAFLPQLLMSAEAATAAFEVIKDAMPRPEERDRGHSIILATVRGDMHDIGKNIVKVMLESFGFHVYDLGRDVPPENVVEACRETGCRLVGLSALMTTTVSSMEETIRQLKEAFPDVRVVAGGAVLTQSYADMIHADKYARDAMDTVRYAQEYYGA